MWFMIGVFIFVILAIAFALLWRKIIRELNEALPIILE